VKNKDPLGRYKDERHVRMQPAGRTGLSELVSKITLLES